MNDKNKNYYRDDIKENCVIEFLCSLAVKPAFSIRALIDKIKKIFRA